MKQAVIQFQGHQYLLKEGQELDIDHYPGKTGEKIILKEVLLSIDEKGKAKIGTPLVKGAELEIEIVKHLKGEKISVRRYRAKSRYRKVKGFRPMLTRIKVKKIKWLKIKQVEKLKKNLVDQEEGWGLRSMVVRK